MAILNDLTSVIQCKITPTKQNTFPKMSTQSMTSSDCIYRCTHLEYYSMWCEYRFQSSLIKVTSSRINRLRPGTLKCSMQDRQNVQLCYRFHSSSTRLFFICFFFCHSSMSGNTKQVVFVQLFAWFERYKER